MSVDGLSEIRTHDDLLIPCRGETVAATRYEPVGVEGPLPALLMYVPYHKDDYITYGAYDPLNRYLAANGNEVVVADMVGTGASSGSIEEMFPQREGKEAAELVEWLAEQRWTTGRVGMYGRSYGGITALYAAANHPDGPEAIVPIETPYPGYRNGYFSGGVFELFGIGMGWLTTVQTLDVKPPTRRRRRTTRSLPTSSRRGRATGRVPTRRRVTVPRRRHWTRTRGRATSRGRSRATRSRTASATDRWRSGRTSASGPTSPPGPT